MVLVSDSSNHRISVFDMDGNFCRTFGNYGTDEGQLQYPAGLVVGPKDGLLYISEETGSRISVFNTNGTFVRCLLSGQITRPQDLVVTVDGQIIVAEGSLHRLSMWR
eukprot:TRINITY_DN13732_c0_g2_i4.p1 TRINITY_DN13732_c0_g2~~TRINITY_DN13732_c0_g2_i4.p1  ORF type:complete len:107 (+),score=34.73 TRINITY_DN13732_c0_g2_i4:223-543(+)